MQSTPSLTGVELFRAGIPTALDIPKSGRVMWVSGRTSPCVTGSCSRNELVFSITTVKPVLCQQGCVRIGMQKGLKGVGKTSSWKTPLGGESMIRNSNCSIVLGAYCFFAPTTIAIRGWSH